MRLAARTSGPRVRLFEGRPQPLIRHVGVDLRRGERGVPENLLHAAQVGTALQQMGRHRMPKSVGAEVGCPFGHLEGTMDDPAHHPGRSACHARRGTWLGQTRQSPAVPGASPARRRRHARQADRGARFAPCSPCRTPGSPDGPDQDRPGRGRTAPIPGFPWRRGLPTPQHHARRPVPQLATAATASLSI